MSLKMNISTDRRMLLLGVCAVTLTGTSRSPAAQRVGAVMAAAGTALLERDANRMFAVNGVDVMLDDVALTGDESRLDLLLGRATRIRLGAHSHLKIDRFVAGTSADVQLVNGPALIDHRPGAEPAFTVTSPYALIAARGTAFFAGPSGGVFGVFVRNGRVDVRTGPGAVSLRAGEGTDIAAPGAAPTPPKRWGDPRIAAALASVS
jgi:ferric-dicitrate binding protein FerR (iron transport regulator)